MYFNIKFDQMNRQVRVPKHPKRIISLVPSQTELLFDLGLDDEVVGVTKFCIHPKEKVKEKTKIGGTKQFHFDRIAALNPDLIIGNKEENEVSQIEALATKYPVWMSDIVTIQDALDMIRQVGQLIQREAEASHLIDTLESHFNKNINTKHPQSLKGSIRAESLTAAYFIWKKPYMVAAKNTFIDEMMQVAGFENVYAEMSRYPTIDLEELKALQPQVILLSSEPYPFKTKHIVEFQTACPNAKVMIVDGEMFSWYGSRLLKSVEYFRRIMNEF